MVQINIRLTPTEAALLYSTINARNISLVGFFRALIEREAHDEAQRIERQRATLATLQTVQKG